MKAASSLPNAYSADCPTRQILDRVGDKWAVLILLLVRDEPMRFNALRRAIEGISQKMLSQVLKSLERDGLIRTTRDRDRAGHGGVFDHAARRDAGRRGRSVARDWAEQNLKEVLNAQRRYDAAAQGYRSVSHAAFTQRHALKARLVRPLPVRLQPAVRSRTAPNRGRDRRRRTSGWPRHRAAGSPWKHRDCRRAARS